MNFKVGDIVTVQASTPIVNPGLPTQGLQAVPCRRFQKGDRVVYLGEGSLELNGLVGEVEKYHSQSKSEVYVYYKGYGLYSFLEKDLELETEIALSGSCGSAAICECGSEKAGLGTHSVWCPKHTPFVGGSK